jgi:ATP-binding cassette subfamily A (ABC1) protein 3
MQDTKSFGMYANGGYSHLQYLIANSILRQQTNNSNASIALAFVPFKADAYISDDFDQILSAMLPFFMLLMFILPVYRLISSIVAEKESKARESMKMMGLSDLSYWASWFTYYLIIVLIISIICTIILSANVFRYTNRGLIFLYFFIYGLSLFGLCTLITAFFSRARVAAITGTLIYFGTSFINAAV